MWVLKSGHFVLWQWEDVKLCGEPVLVEKVLTSK